MTSPETDRTMSAEGADKPGCSCWLWLAGLLALAGVAGSLWLTVGMGLKACPLCLYQRVFVMGSASVLCMGLLLGGARHALVALLALPGAVGGLATAGFHTYLVHKGTLECPKGLLGLGTGPEQSLALHGLLVLVLLIAVVAGKKVGPEFMAVVGALVLGGLLAGGAIWSAPPLPEPKPYTVPLDQDGCRPVYRPPQQSERT